MNKVILLIGPNHKRLGGISQFIQSLMQCSFRERYKFKLIDTTSDSQNKIRKVVDKLMHIFFYSYTLLFKKFKLIHIHTSSYLGFYEKLILLIIAKLFNQRTIFHIHGGEFVSFFNRSKNKKLIKWALSFSDIVLFVDYEAMILLDIKNGRFLQNFTTIPDYEDISSAINEVPNFLTVSVLESRKKVDLMIKACSILNKEGYTFKLTIAGDGPEKNRLKSLATSLNLNKFINFTGSIKGSEKDKIFRKADIFLLASTSESFAITIIEAMSYSLDIIATNVGIVPYVNSKIGTISTIEINNLNSLVSIMRAKLNNEDISSLKKRKKLNRNLCISKFSENAFLIKLEDIYSTIGKN